MRGLPSGRVLVVAALAGSLSGGGLAFAGPAVAGPAGAVSGPVTPPQRGPFVTILFSRSEVTAADNCVPDDRGIASLDTVVAPYLHSLGISATATLETGKTQPAAPFCIHYDESLGVSWADAANLADHFGWSFGSATATYPVRRIDHLTPAQAYAETCGSAAAIDAHGLPGGHSIIAYPGAAPSLPVKLQATDGAKCFAWGREYGNAGTTPASAGTTPPYWQHTTVLNGGSCHLPTAPCYHVAPTQTGHLPRYVLPSREIARIKALQPGQWFTFQSYILVTGKSPPYTSNKTRWDCTSSSPDLHWTNDNERYCYSDWQQVVKAVAALPNVTVTDPLTVGEAFGRPARYP